MTFDVKDLMERYDVGQHTVLQWIAIGELRAVNVARKPGTRPKFRITQEALEAFEALRMTTTPPDRSRRTRQAVDAMDIIK